MTNTFKPLLASPAPDDLSTLRYPVLVSPKLDGIRCVVREGKALSRNLKSIPNDYIRTWIEANVPSGVDGEIMLADSRAPFNDVSSAVMKKTGEPNFLFHAFDTTTADSILRNSTRDCVDLPFETRLQFLVCMMGQRNNEHASVLEHRLVQNQDELTALYANWLEQGFEGLMIRDPKGRYKYGRSTTKEGILLKLKSFEDAEAVVVDVIEEMANNNEATIDALGRTKRSTAKAGKTGKGVMGALKCVIVGEPGSFEIGSGFTAQQRADIWKEFGTQCDDGYPCGVVGKIVKYRHQPPPGGRQPGQAPRFPVFLGFRDIIDA